MKILYLGKYPPLQGGESTKAYWLLRELGQRGHEIDVVTTANDASPGYKYNLGRQGYRLQPRNVRVHAIDQGKAPFFIPKYLPSNERVISKGLEVMDKQLPDIIFSWYLLPYAPAAHALNRMSGVPFCVQHAGSDKKRLLPWKSISTYLDKVLEDSSRVFSYPSAASDFAKRGCSVFTHSPSPAPVYKYEDSASNDNNSSILFAGKFSRGKGIYRLLRAMEHVPEEYHLTLLGGPRHRLDDTLPDRVSVKNPVPCWEMPGMYQSVGTVTIPEEGFDVESHKSMIPIEAMLCGHKPVVSKSIIDKYGILADEMISANTFNPKEYAEALVEGIRAGQCSDRAQRIRELLPPFEEYVSIVETELESIISESMSPSIDQR
jgi:glycosyltransferase involved in cell wall biosynthesis